jgi:hypothetical protein
MAESAERPRRLAESTTGPAVELRGQPATVSLNILEEAPNVQEDALNVRDEAGRMVLNVEGIEFDRVPDGYYEIYLNLPANQAPDYRSRYYVGNLAFFGLEPHGEAAEAGAPSHEATVQGYDITEAVRNLRASSDWNKEEAKVTFVLRTPEPPPGVALQQEEAVPVRIHRLTITQE